MSNIIDNVLEKAIKRGACRLAEGEKDMEGLCSLFFSPQGREFCIKHDFPSITDFRKLKSEHCAYFNVFCDLGTLRVSGGTKYAAVGKTRLEAKFEGADELHTIILMHGAEAEIEVSNYAVVTIERTPDCKVHIINKDNTAIVRY